MTKPTEHKAGHAIRKAGSCEVKPNSAEAKRLAKLAGKPLKAADDEKKEPKP